MSRLEVGDGPEDAALETPFRQDGEKPLGVKWNVQRGWRKPSLHDGMLVGGVVVEDRMNRLTGRNFTLDSVEEADGP